MNKGYIFDSLKAGMLSAGFSEKEVNLHLQHYTEKFAGMTDDALEADMAQHGDVDGFVLSVIDNRNRILMKDEAYRDAVGMAEENAGTSGDEPETVEPAESAELVDAELPQQEAAAEPEAPAEDDPMGVYDLFFEEPGTDEAENEAPLDAIFGDEPEENVTAVETDDEPQTVETTMTETEPAEITEEATDADDDSDMRVAAPAEPVTSADITDPPTAPFSLVPDTAVKETIKIAEPEAPSVTERHEATKQILIASGDTLAVDDTLVAEVQPEAEQPEDKTRHSVLRDKTYFGPYDPDKLKAFRIKTVLLSPFTGLLVLLCVGSTFLLYFITALLVPMVLLLMLAVCVAGLVLSLVGMIYGVSQVFTVKPVGLYELGLGIVLLGVTILVSVLLYNLAVRVIPKLVRLTWGLVKKVFYSAVDRYCYRRGEAARP